MTKVKKITKKLKYPKTVAAAQQISFSHWALGDALLEECGPPSVDGVNDGSYAKIVEAAAEILENTAIEYEDRYLARHREIAFKFPKSVRTEFDALGKKVSWFACRDAETKEAVLGCIKAYPKQTVISDHMIRKYRAAMKAADERKYQTELTKQRNALEDAKRRKAEAKTEAEREAAQKDIDANRLPPQRGESKTEWVDPPAMMVMFEIESAILGAKKAAKWSIETAEEHLPSFNNDILQALLYQAEECDKAWQAFINLIKGQKRAKLTIVK